MTQYWEVKQLQMKYKAWLQNAENKVHKPI